MAEDKQGKSSEQTRSLRHATFECAACGSGTENFLTLFADGTCSRCGNPAGVVVETSRSEDIQKIRESVMVVSSGKDTEVASKIMKEMLQAGIAVIDPTMVVDNEQAGNRANVLAFLANECKHVLVIPSDKGQFSEDRLVSAAVEQSILSGNTKVVPLYPNDSYHGKSLILDTIAGVQWEGTPEMGWGKDKFIKSIKHE